MLPPYLSLLILDQPQGIIDDNPTKTLFEHNNSTTLTKNPERPLVSVKVNTNTTGFPIHDYWLRWIQRNPELGTD
jgi:hypothetical protein